MIRADSGGGGGAARRLGRRLEAIVCCCVDSFVVALTMTPTTSSARRVQHGRPQYSIQRTAGAAARLSTMRDIRSTQLFHAQCPPAEGLPPLPPAGPRLHLRRRYLSGRRYCPSGTMVGSCRCWTLPWDKLRAGSCPRLHWNRWSRLKTGHFRLALSQLNGTRFFPLHRHQNPRSRSKTGRFRSTLPRVLLPVRLISPSGIASLSGGS